MNVLKQLNDDRAQDAFEYMIVVGAVVIAMVVGFMALDVLIGAFMDLMGPSVDTAP